MSKFDNSLNSFLYLFYFYNLKKINYLFKLPFKSLNGYNIIKLKSIKLD